MAAGISFKQTNGIKIKALQTKIKCISAYVEYVTAQNILRH